MLTNKFKKLMIILVEALGLIYIIVNMFPDDVAHMSLVVRKTVLQKMARGLKFRIQKVERLYYPCSENKGSDQLICVFIFAFAKKQFSHEAHMIIMNTSYSFYIK